MSDTSEKAPSYGRLLGHIEHHKVREWFLRGAKDEDANTIREAVERIPNWKFERYVAHMLAGNLDHWEWWGEKP